MDGWLEGVWVQWGLSLRIVIDPCHPAQRFTPMGGEREERRLFQAELLPRARAKVITPHIPIR